MDKLDKLLYKYWENFNEAFPTMLTRQLTTEELIKTLENCLENNTKYEVEELNPNADY